MAWAGGKGSGKSATLCAVVVMVAASRPGAECLLGMDCAKSLRDIHLPMFLPLVRSVGGEWRPSDNEARLPNGSIVRLRHLDIPGDPALGGSPVEGGNYHLVAADECQQVDPRYWTVFQERARVMVADLAGRQCAPLVITSGLPVGTWWCAATAKVGGTVWRPKTSANKNNAPDYEARLRASMTEARARAMIDAEELAPEGQIVTEYRGELEPRGSWTDWQPDWSKSRTVLAMDLGVNNPHALLFAEDAERGRWVVIREWYSTGRHVTIGEMCRRIARDVVPRSKWGGQRDPRIPLDEAVTDPAGRSTSAQTGSSDLDLLAMSQPDGLGMRPLVETIPERRSVVGSLNRMRVAIERGRLMFSAEMMRAGAMAADERSLHKSLLAYRWDPRGVEEPFKDGVSDHACFPAETPVLMADGTWRAIWSINPGELVQTRSGPRPVTDAAQTGVRQVLRLTLSDGSTVEATEDHPFATPLGMRPLHALRYGDTVCVCKKKPSSSTARSTTDTRNLRAVTAKSTFGRMGSAVVLGSCTATFTRPRTGRFLPVMSCTTSTGTHSTTSRRTSQRCRCESTRGCTHPNSWPTQSCEPAPGSSWTWRGRRRTSGTEAAPAGSGIPSTAERCGLTGSPSQERASSAGRCTKRATAACPSFAPTTASRRRDEHPASTMSSESASPAVASSWSTATRKPGHAVAYVESVVPTRRAPVYNLTVDGEHEYCAAGVWVSNCDALRYGWRRFGWHDVADAPPTVVQPAQPRRLPAALAAAKGGR